MGDGLEKILSDERYDKPFFHSYERICGDKSPGRIERYEQAKSVYVGSEKGSFLELLTPMTARPEFFLDRWTRFLIDEGCPADTPGQARRAKLKFGAIADVQNLNWTEGFRVPTPAGDLVIGISPTLSGTVVFPKAAAVIPMFIEMESSAATAGSIPLPLHLDGTAYAYGKKTQFDGVLDPDPNTDGIFVALFDGYKLRFYAKNEHVGDASIIEAVNNPVQYVAAWQRYLGRLLGAIDALLPLLDEAGANWPQMKPNDQGEVADDVQERNRIAEMQGKVVAAIAEVDRVAKMANAFIIDNKNHPIAGKWARDFVRTQVSKIRNISGSMRQLSYELMDKDFEPKFFSEEAVNLRQYLSPGNHVLRSFVVDDAVRANWLEIDLAQGGQKVAPANPIALRRIIDRIIEEAGNKVEGMRREISQKLSTVRKALQNERDNPERLRVRLNFVIDWAKTQAPEIRDAFYGVRFRIDKILENPKPDERQRLLDELVKEIDAQENGFKLKVLGKLKVEIHDEGAVTIIDESRGLGLFDFIETHSAGVHHEGVTTWKALEDYARKNLGPPGSISAQERQEEVEGSGRTKSITAIHITFSLADAKSSVSGSEAQGAPVNDSAPKAHAVPDTSQKASGDATLREVAVEPSDDEGTDDDEAPPPRTTTVLRAILQKRIGTGSPSAAGAGSGQASKKPLTRPPGR